jgi:hypothetical protein
MDTTLSALTSARFISLSASERLWILPGHRAPPDRVVAESEMLKCGWLVEIAPVKNDGIG